MMEWTGGICSTGSLLTVNSNGQEATKLLLIISIISIKALNTSPIIALLLIFLNRMWCNYRPGVNTGLSVQLVLRPRHLVMQT